MKQVVFAFRVNFLGQVVLSIGHYCKPYGSAEGFYSWRDATPQEAVQHFQEATA